MRQVLRMAVLVSLLGLALGGCSVDIDREDSGVSHRFGSDYFGAGSMLSLTDPVEGDAFLAAGQIATAGEVGGDLVVAGGEVSVGGNVGDDLYAAGGEVQVDAIVNGNARVAGGDVTVGPATVIAGGATLSGGRIRFEGNTHGYLQARGGRVTIAGQVHRDVDVRADDLVVLPGTQIGGRLVYRGPTRPAIPEGAVITGGVEYHQATATAYLHGRHGRVHAAVHWVGRALWFAGVFFVGALFLVLFPGLSARAAATIGREPLRSAGLGLAVLVCAPVVGVVLCITIIGIPLALLLVPMYLLALFLGWVVAASFIGDRGLAAVRGTLPETTGWRLLALLLALVALAIVRHLPLVGGLVVFLALIAGIGAFVWEAWSGRRAAPAAGGPR
jgi:hypothetical protein